MLGTRSWFAKQTLAALVALMCAGSVAYAGGPLKVTLPINGADKKERQEALQAGLKNALESADSIKVEPKKIMVVLKEGSSLMLSQVDAVIKQISTEAEPISIDMAELKIFGTCGVQVQNLGETKDDAVITALKALKGMGDIVPTSPGNYMMRLKGADGVKIGDVNAALQKLIPPVEGQPKAEVGEVAWMPARQDGPEHPGKGGCGKGSCGKGGCGKGK